MSSMRYTEAPEESCEGFVERDGKAVALIWESHEIGRLFAAAPELLTALEDCIAVMTHELHGLSVIQPELAAARAAIAKGTGKEPA